ncbi:hypothetical protein CEXT_154791 [Caerostris extrusa]|uniref:Uncharacterized protein n=1 Tax=Caerostris extrusa TaxID=172846 RepID=A0AAV4X3I9_CAEEX|nr:hypothetical protein CEXT_154791 [Caerostris extrusa]
MKAVFLSASLGGQLKFDQVVHLASFNIEFCTLPFPLVTTWNTEMWEPVESAQKRRNSMGPLQADFTVRHPVFMRREDLGFASFRDRVSLPAPSVCGHI